MIPELGLFFLIMAFFFSLLIAIIPFFYRRLTIASSNDAACLYTKAQFLCAFFSFLLLIYCFLSNDFTVLYVASNASIALPWFYKLCAVWGGHEGSMLLWVVILSFWMLLVSLLSHSLPPLFRTRVLSILGMLSAGFILFLLTVSNPFIRSFDLISSTGRDLNPLLQDPGFLFHPPMLYMGYVGFSVAFAFAMAALWSGEWESTWVKWTRPWTLAAWCCLTAGITLGSWWAYRELGWGGFWFWDPVENASFMPWLAGTALIHGLALSEKRSQWVGFTVLLAIFAFSLSLIGTFIVRSGVLTSVHAFAVDPARGAYILYFLSLTIGGAFFLFSTRIRSFKNNIIPAFGTQDNALLINNIFLITMMFTVLIGTLYPLLIEGLNLGKLSVGAPYFNRVFVPLMLPFLFLMGVGVHLPKNTKPSATALWFLGMMFILVLMMTRFIFLTKQLYFYLNAFLGLLLALWVIFSTALMVLQMAFRHKIRHLGLAFWGMVCAHIGVAVTVIGITVSTSYGLEDDIKIKMGQRVHFAGFTIQLIGERSIQASNYAGIRAQFEIKNKDHQQFIYPEKRFYHVAQMAMTDAAIDVTPFRDIYIALSEPIEKERAWLIRLYYKPFVRWIWFGGGMIFLGGLLALLDRRYFKKEP